MKSTSAAEQYDILIVGAGAAGIAAAKGAYEAGCRSILLVDCKAQLGGILLQCAHHGFAGGQSGTAYAAQLLHDFPAEVQCLFNTTVTVISADKTAVLANAVFGSKTIAFQQLILATGCYEIPIGALPITGTRPTGIYTSGHMQELVNLHNYMPVGPVVILGSGDLGLIMAQHLCNLGCAVTLIEQKKQCGGMLCNRAVLNHANVSLICGTTIAEVQGETQIESVVLADGTVLPCSTLLIAVGLQPDKALIHDLQKQSKQMPHWLWLCGNCNRVHSMVEAVVYEGIQAGKKAAEHILTACR